jgi:hypothetical protein
VGELDAHLVDGEQAGAGQPLHHRRHLRVRPLLQFGAAQRAPGVGAALSGLDHPQQQLPGGARLLWGQLPVHLLGARRAARPLGSHQAFRVLPDDLPL